MPVEAGAHTPVMAGALMAGTALLVSGPVGYLLRYVGHVKLLLPVATMITPLLLTLLLLDETRSRVTEVYFVIGCVLSVCDCCFQVCFTGAHHLQYIMHLYTPCIYAVYYAFIYTVYIRCHNGYGTLRTLLRSQKHAREPQTQC